MRLLAVLNVLFKYACARQSSRVLTHSVTDGRSHEQETRCWLLDSDDVSRFSSAPAGHAQSRRPEGTRALPGGPLDQGDVSGQFRPRPAARCGSFEQETSGSVSWLLDSDDVSGSLFIRLPAGHAQRRAGAQRAPARSRVCSARVILQEEPFGLVSMSLHRGMFQVSPDGPLTHFASPRGEKYRPARAVTFRTG